LRPNRGKGVPDGGNGQLQASPATGEAMPRTRGLPWYDDGGAGDICRTGSRYHEDARPAPFTLLCCITVLVVALLLHPSCQAARAINML